MTGAEAVIDGVYVRSARLVARPDRVEASESVATTCDPAAPPYRVTASRIEVIPGDRIAQVLQRMQYSAQDLARRVKAALDQRVKDGAIRPKEGVQLADFYEEVMRGYTYLAGMSP